MEGRWYTTDRSARLTGALIAVIIVLAGGSAAAAVASVLTTLLITAVTVIVIMACGLAAFVVHRVRHPDTRLIPKPHYHGLATGTEHAAIAPKQPPMIVNNYFGGTHTHHGSDPGTPAGDLTPLIRGAITGSGPHNGRAAT